jgi:hypothetical protein
MKMTSLPTNSLSFKNGVQLNKIELPTNGLPEVPPCKHNIWIYDRSGSMYSLIRQVIKDLEHFADKLQDGDTLSVAWFSTENGTYRYILKGHVVGQHSPEIVKNMLHQNNTVIGLTCFSEVLKETEVVVKDLLAMGISDSFALMFFTDGYPVVSNYSKELKAIFESINALAPVISDAILIGYGDYYNRELMADMASAIGGTLVHTSRLCEFEEYMGLFLDGAVGIPRKEVTVDGNGKVLEVFTVNGKQITRYDVKEGVVRVPATVTEVYVLCGGAE